MDEDLLRPRRPCYRSQKLELSEEIPNCVAVHSANPRVLLFT